MPARGLLVGLAVIGVSFSSSSAGGVAPFVAVAVAFTSLVCGLDYSGAIAPGTERRLAWVDGRFPASATASLVHLGYSRPDQPCAAAGEYEQQGLAVLTEFFNTRVDRVYHLGSATIGRDNLASVCADASATAASCSTTAAALRAASCGARLATAGRRTAARAAGSRRPRTQYQAGSSLTLWQRRATAPVPSSTPSLSRRGRTGGNADVAVRRPVSRSAARLPAPWSAIVVEVTRGDVVEARHVVHAVAVRDGRVELAAGDPGLVTYLRSSAKPIQALPVVRARPDLDDEQVALALRLPRRGARAARGRPPDARRRAGARGRPRVRGRRGAHRAQLLGQARRLPRALSGARAGRSRATASPITRASARCSTEVAAAAEVDPARSPSASTAAASPTFALHPGAMPRTRSAGCASLDGGDRVVRAMRAHPQLLARAGRRRRAPHAHARRLGRRRAAPRASCARRPRTGSASRSRSTDGAFRAIVPGARRATRAARRRRLGEPA